MCVSIMSLDRVPASTGCKAAPIERQNLFLSLNNFLEKPLKLAMSWRNLLFRLAMLLTQIRWEAGRAVGTVGVRGEGVTREGFEGEASADDCRGRPSWIPGHCACRGFFRSGDVGQSSVLLMKANKAPNPQKYYSSTAGKTKDLKSKWCE